MMRPVIVVALAIIVTLLSFQNCSNKIMTPTTPVIDYSSVQAIVPDCQFNRNGLMNGDTVQAFRSSTVSTGQMCQSEVRTCRNGVLSGTFEYAFCLPGAPAACLIDGRTIPNGGTIKVFEKSSVPFGQQCDQVSQIRKCENGVLSGSYTFASCIVNSAVHCTFNNFLIENGQSRRFYREASVPYLGTCVQEMRVCNNSVLSGTFAHSDCRAQDAQSCTLNGVTLQNGENKMFYDRTGVPFGQTCPAGRFRTCSNGTLDGDVNFQHASCAPANAASCTFNGQPVAHDATVDAWSVSTVPFGDTCDSKKELRKCNNMVLSGSFTHASCAVGVASQTCGTLDGVTMNHGQRSPVYKAPLMSAPDNCTSSGNSESGYCDNGTLKVDSASGAVISGGRYFNCGIADKHLTQWEGSASGTYHNNVSCGSGARVTGLFYGADGQNQDIDSIGVLCSTGTGPIVGTSQGNPRHSRCSGAKNVVGVYGQTIGYLNYTITICANDDGTGREQLADYGWVHPVAMFNYGLRTWYQMCKPGYVVSRMMVHTGGTVNGFNLECTQVAQPANINCQGVWLDQGCHDPSGNTHPTYPANLEQFHILQHKGGSGTECSTQHLATRAGSTSCYIDYGGGGGDGGP